MTILVAMPATLACPCCGTIVASGIIHCWSCGESIQGVHESCGICGEPSGHGRHRGPHGLAYYCGCGFVATSRSEILAHLEAMGR